MESASYRLNITIELWFREYMVKNAFFGHRELILSKGGDLSVFSQQELDDISMEAQHTSKKNAKLEMPSRSLSS